MKILLATNNKHKVSEIREILSTFSGISIITPKEYGFELVPKEDGVTFEQNAEIKAKEFFQTVGIPVIADDSGLEVFQLDDAPGVNSARYAGENSDDKSNRNKLLSEIDFSRDTYARFRCVICFYDGVTLHFSYGAVEGKIIQSERGEGGFGYDPIFVPAGFNETFAEMSPDVKNTLSHRGKALQEFRTFLTSYLKIAQK